MQIGELATTYIQHKLAKRYHVPVSVIKTLHLNVYAGGSWIWHFGFSHTFFYIERWYKEHNLDPNNWHDREVKAKCLIKEEQARTNVKAIDVR
jgi:hypothetical protein